MGGATPLDFYVFHPTSAQPGARILVAVHGISRRAREQALHLAPWAERLGVVLVAPRFAVARYRDYQRLGREGLGLRADQALDAVLAQVSREENASASPILLFGWSGGAQVAHRYILAYPERVVGAVIAAAGWYTFPDLGRKCPHGLAPSARLPGVRFDSSAFFGVPILTVVGTEDVARDAALRRSKKVDRRQGRSRLERAIQWTKAMERTAEVRGFRPSVTLRTLPGVGHSFSRSMRRGALGEIAFDFLSRHASAEPCD